MSLSLTMREAMPEAAQPDLRSVPPQAEFQASPDIVARLRQLDSRTPFARGIILEAAAEIEKLRAAIRAHREQVWGSDEPDHASDAELYGNIG